jgi:predicted GTPase
MSRGRIAVVLVLLLGPFFLLAGLGCYFLWTSRLGFTFWWVLAACFALGYWLAWRWQRRRLLLLPDVSGVPAHWTERDQEAWKLVEARATAAARMEQSALTDAKQFLATAEEMVRELATFYHPEARDPIGSLTIPELLAAVELATGDMAELMDRYVPGGHFLCIDDFRRARQALGWYRSANRAYWVVAAVFAPVSTGLRYLASRFGMSLPWGMLQQNLLVWFYAAYIHRLGAYLIDLNTGRLRVGAPRYRELRSRRTDAAHGSAPAAEADAVDPLPEVVVALLGQAKSGKSSLANALLGERRAATDVLPVAEGVERYRVRPPGIPSELVLLDTVGYGNAGPRADQVKATRAAAQQSDLQLLIVHARNPARQADLDMLKSLKDWFAEHPDRKRPPLIAVMTHIDLLSPMMEWAPPYRWQQPTRPKEQSIRDAASAVMEQLGEYVTTVIPVCTAPGKVYGIEEGLLPAVAGLLDEAQGVALLRVLRAEADTGRVRKVFRQLLEAGKGLAWATWQSLKP